MIVCKCLSKERDTSGKITRYALQDSCGHTCIMGADELKQKIHYKEIDVLNLLLTSDNRLIDKNITGPLVIPETNKIQCDNTLSESDFISKNDYNKELRGWMSSDNTEYHESIKGVPGGVLTVARGYWSIHLQPEKSKRVGAWVNPGYTIYEKDFRNFISKLRNNYENTLNRANQNPSEPWEFEDETEVVYKIKQSIYNGTYVMVWPKFSQVYLNSLTEVEEFIKNLELAATRVNEIREIKGWKLKKNTRRNSDGTIETRGNWFNKFFGK